jgi:eukaryotic-like serine/threonine-protein kinase
LAGVIITIPPSGDGYLYALNASTSTKLWSYNTGKDVFSSPAVANGVVYIGSLVHNVDALNASTGALLWSYTTGGAVGSSSYDKKVYALKAKTGALLWSYTTDSGMYSSPAVSNGVLYVGSLEGGVYAFGLK